LLKSIVLNCLLLVCPVFPVQSQTPPDAAKSRVDAVILKAYESASAQLPCKVKSEGKPQMMKWQDVGKCLSNAYENVDWEDVSRQLQSIRKEFGLQANEILNMADQSLSAHAMPYDKVFIVKDTRALLPLSNALLKFLPDGSLQDLPVTEKLLKKQVGTFSGIYLFEKTGEISGSRNRLVLFQYTDDKGKIHSASDRLLLDTFGVPWKDAMSQPGFRLSPDKIELR
jgi:hypothetical protein